MNIKDHLMAALALAKAEEQDTRNTMLPREIGAIVNRHFKSKETMQEVASTMKSGSVDKPKSLASVRDPRMKTWVPGKKKNIPQRATSQLSAAEAKDTGEDNDPMEVELEALAGMDQQALLEHFGTLKNVKKYAKNVGFPINQRLSGDKFIAEFISVVDDALGMGFSDGEEEE